MSSGSAVQFRSKRCFTNGCDIYAIKEAGQGNLNVLNSADCSSDARHCLPMLASTYLGAGSSSGVQAKSARGMSANLFPPSLLGAWQRGVSTMGRLAVTSQSMRGRRLQSQVHGLPCSVRLWRPAMEATVRCFTWTHVMSSIHSIVTSITMATMVTRTTMAIIVIMVTMLYILILTSSILLLWR